MGLDCLQTTFLLFQIPFSGIYGIRRTTFLRQDTISSNHSRFYPKIRLIWDLKNHFFCVGYNRCGAPPYFLISFSLRWLCRISSQTIPPQTTSSIAPVSPTVQSSLSRNNLNTNADTKSIHPNMIRFLPCS